MLVVSPVCVQACCSHVTVLLDRSVSFAFLRSNSVEDGSLIWYFFVAGAMLWCALVRVCVCVFVCECVCLSVCG